jgi:hypothetical protein
VSTPRTRWAASPFDEMARRTGQPRFIRFSHAVAPQVTTDVSGLAVAQAAIQICGAHWEPGHPDL